MHHPLARLMAVSTILALLPALMPSPAAHAHPRALARLSSLLETPAGRLVMSTRPGKRAAQSLSEALYLRTGARVDRGKLVASLRDLETSLSKSQLTSAGRLPEVERMIRSLERVRRALRRARPGGWKRADRIAFVEKVVDGNFRSIHSYSANRIRFLNGTDDSIFRTSGARLLPAPDVVIPLEGHLLRFLRRLQPTRANALQQALERQAVELDALLTLGQVDAAVARFEATFLAVERAHELHRELARIRSEVLRFQSVHPESTAQISRFVREIDEAISMEMRKLGRHADRYLELRQHLAGGILGNGRCAGGTCAQAAALAMERLGLSNPHHFAGLRSELARYREKLHRIMGTPAYRRLRLPALSANRPSLDAIWELLAADTPAGTLARVSREAQHLYTEMAHTLQRILAEPYLLRSMYDLAQTALPRGIARTVFRNEHLVETLFRRVIDFRARRDHFAIITDLVRTPMDDAVRLERLRDFAAADPDLLVTFARRTDAQAPYYQLMDLAESQPHTRTFGARLRAMKEDPGSIANRLGEIAVLHEAPRYRRLGLYLAGGVGVTGAGVGYLWFANGESSESHEVEEVGEEDVEESTYELLDTVFGFLNSVDEAELERAVRNAEDETDPN